MKRDAVGAGLVGVVRSFSASEGQGTVEDGSGRAYPFHCTQITGGARVIAVHTPVAFDVVAGHMGRWEATRLRADEEASFLCPVCATPVTGLQGTYEICPTCSWEDDPVQSADAGYAGGANDRSLSQARTDWDARLADSAQSAAEAAPEA